MHFGLKRNVYMDGVIDGKWSVGYPSKNETEAVNGKPGDNGPGAVLILGTRSNAPMGFFADGMCDPNHSLRISLWIIKSERKSTVPCNRIQRSWRSIP